MKKVTKKTKPVVVEQIIDKPEVKTEEKKSLPPIVYATVVLALIVVLFFVRRITASNDAKRLEKEVLPAAIKKVLNGQNVPFTIKDLKETSGVYEFTLNLGQKGQEQKYSSYISKDGKILFTSGIKLDTLNKPTTQGAETKKLTCNDITKTEKSNLTAFVVADCPFGLQMQRVMKLAIAEAPELANVMTVKYLGAVSEGKITSMHGDKEAQENLKQICIREEQKENYWNYLGCYMKEGKSDDCSGEVGINTVQLSACMEEPKRGLAFAQADFALANKYKIGSSPTLLSNGAQTVSEFDFGGRTPDALKQVICCGSKTKGGYCNKDLSKDNVASSFSTNDKEAAGDNTGAANCGTN